jgi:6-phosphogluconolactonase
MLTRLAHTDAPLDRMELFFVDERCVPLADERSNFQVAQAALIDPRAERGFPIPRDRIHPFECDPGRRDLGVGAYEQELAAAGGGLDIAVLGIGEDGHVASLFPGGGTPTDPEAHFMAVREAPKPPPERMSATPQLLQTAETTVLVAFGDGKKNALAAFLADEGTISACPARVVRNNTDLHVITDLAV